MNRCHVCSQGAEVRAQVDRLIVEQVPFRDIPRQIDAEGISYHSIWRHAQAHLSADLRDAVAEAQGMRAGAYAVRLQEIADRAREASDAALADGSPRDAARAIDSEIRALMVLMQRLNIGDKDTVASLREGNALASAMVRILHDHPEIGLAPLLVQELREQHEPDLADAIEQQTAKREITK